MNDMANMIQLQDEFIATMSRISRTNRNYYVVLSKATKKVWKGCAALGFDITQADQAVQDAHDMLRLAEVSR